jgi:hypothetical protein
MVSLQHDTPQDLVGASLDELKEAARAVPEWDDVIARSLDHVYRQKLVTLLSRRAGEEELSELADHLRRVIPPSRRAALDELDAPWSRIWLAYAALVETRIGVLRAQDPGEALGKVHVAKILEIVRQQDGVAQQEVMRRAGLRSKANLTRVLNVMEANELVERRRVGNENRLYLGVRAREVSTEREVGRETPRRGMGYLTRAGR